MHSLSQALVTARIARSLATIAAASSEALFPVSSDSASADLASLIQDTELADVTLKLFENGHYALAVEQAYKCLDRRVSQRSGIEGSGQDLMFQVFSVDKPRLQLNALKNVSDKDEQDGFRFIFAGCMRAIRNPRAHDHLFLDEREDALLMIAWAEYLLRRVEASTIVGITT